MIAIVSDNPNEMLNKLGSGNYQGNQFSLMRMDTPMFVNLSK